MENARVGGRVEAIGIAVSAAGGSWNMNGLNVQHSLCLDRARIKGRLELVGAEVGKLFVANGIEVDGGETAIHADLVRVGGNFEMTSAKLVGQLRCPGADIRGQMRLSDTRLFGSELAVRGDGSKIQGGCFFSRTFIVGLVRFPASTIGNQFRFGGATVKVESGPAIIASGSRFERDVEFDGGFETIGGVLFDQVHIAGMLNLSGSRLKKCGDCTCWCDTTHVSSPAGPNRH